MGVHAIPFHVLEKMGLLVADDGDGGSDDELGQRVVDANDWALRVFAPDGSTVFNAATDDFEQFYRQIRSAWKGRSLTRWRQTIYGDRSWIKFAGREVAESGSRVGTMSFDFDDRAVPRFGTHWEINRFRHGQVIDRTKCRGNRDNPNTAEPYGESRTDFRTLVSWRERPDLSTDGMLYTITDLATGENQLFSNRRAAEAAHRQIRAANWRFELSATKKGWAFTVHGVRIHVYRDPSWSDATVVPSILNALLRLPPGLLKTYMDYVHDRQGTHALTFHLLDFEKAKKYPERFRKRLDEFPKGMKSIFDGKFLGGVDASWPTAWLTGASIFRNNGASGVHYRADNSIALFAQPPLLPPQSPDQDGVEIWTILHEIGHGIEHMLGPVAANAFASFFEHYMETALQAIKATSEERAALKTAWQPNTSTIDSVKRHKNLLQRLAEAGWLPTAYAGTNALEFWAELVAHGFFPLPPPGKKPFEVVADQIRELLVGGGTPEAMAARLARILTQTPDAP